MSNSIITNSDQFQFQFQSILGIGAPLNRTEPNRSNFLKSSNRTEPNRTDRASQKVQTEPISIRFGSVRLGSAQFETEPVPSLIGRDTDILNFHSEGTYCNLIFSTM
jgi:hypothetical protein